MEKNIIYILGKGNLINEIVKHYNDLIIFVFTAKWCGPCKKIKNEIETDILNRYMKCCFMYIDVDDSKNESILADFKIDAMPTFVFNKINDDKLEKLHTFSGADKKLLEELLIKFLDN
jgi:thiol-disulfide isomerase/thioredoxin